MTARYLHGSSNHVLQIYCPDVVLVCFHQKIMKGIDESCRFLSMDAATMGCRFGAPMFSGRLVTRSSSRPCGKWSTLLAGCVFSWVFKLAFSGISFGFAQLSVCVLDDGWSQRKLIGEYCGTARWRTVTMDVPKSHCPSSRPDLLDRCDVGRFETRISPWFLREVFGHFLLQPDGCTLTEEEGYVAWYQETDLTDIAMACIACCLHVLGSLIPAPGCMFLIAFSPFCLASFFWSGTYLSGETQTIVWSGCGVRFGVCTWTTTCATMLEHLKYCEYSLRRDPKGRCLCAMAANHATSCQWCARSSKTTTIPTNEYTHSSLDRRQFFGPLLRFGFIRCECSSAGPGSRSPQECAREFMLDYIWTDVTWALWRRVLLAGSSGRFWTLSFAADGCTLTEEEGYVASYQETDLTDIAMGVHRLLPICTGVFDTGARLHVFDCVSPFCLVSFFLVRDVPFGRNSDDRLEWLWGEIRRLYVDHNVRNHFGALEILLIFASARSERSLFMCNGREPRLGRGVHCACAEVYTASALCREAMTPAPGVYAAPALCREVHGACVKGVRSTSTPPFGNVHGVLDVSGDHTLASRSMIRHASVKALSSTTSRSTLDARLCKLTELNLPRSGYGWRRISLLPTDASNNVLVACHNHRVAIVVSAPHATRVRAARRLRTSP